MLRRINWGEPTEEEGEQPEDAPPNYCELVWEGSVQQPAFERFTVEVWLLTSSTSVPVPSLQRIITTERVCASGAEL